MLAVLLTAGSLLRPRSHVRGRCLLLAECGESARQAASKDTYPLLERPRRAFGSPAAPRRSRRTSPEAADGPAYGTFMPGINKSSAGGRV